MIKDFERNPGEVTKNLCLHGGYILVGLLETVHKHINKIYVITHRNKYYREKQSREGDKGHRQKNYNFKQCVLGSVKLEDTCEQTWRVYRNKP